MKTLQTVERLKRGAEALTGLGRPKPDALQRLVRTRKPWVYRFRDDGETPNNPYLGLVHYRTPVALDARYDPAAVFERLFALNGWRGSWRDGIYPHNHFHSGTHETLGIARGEARVRFGGKRGRVLALKAGDAVVIPAGVGHRRLSASKELLVVGAYPRAGRYDEPAPAEIRIEEARASVREVPPPPSDPVYGKGGPLVAIWGERNALRGSALGS